MPSEQSDGADGHRVAVEDAGNQQVCPQLAQAGHRDVQDESDGEASRPAVSANRSRRSHSAATARRGKPVTRTRRTRSRAGVGSGRGWARRRGIMGGAIAVTGPLCGPRLRRASLASRSGSGHSARPRAQPRAPYACCDQGDGDDGGRLDAQDPRPEAHRHEPSRAGRPSSRPRKPPSGPTRMAVACGSSRAARERSTVLALVQGQAPRRELARQRCRERRSADRRRNVRAAALPRRLAGDLLPARAAVRLPGGRRERAVSTGTMRATPSSEVFCTRKSMRPPRGTAAAAPAADGGRRSLGDRRRTTLPEHELRFRRGRPGRPAPRPRHPRRRTSVTASPGRARSTRAEMAVLVAGRRCRLAPAQPLGRDEQPPTAHVGRGGAAPPTRPRRGERRSSNPPSA